MYSNFKEQAIQYVKQAVHEDNAKAFPFIHERFGILHFRTHLKIREAITLKFTEYLRSPEEIGALIDDAGAGPAANGGDTATKTKDGEGDGEDPEQAKLRTGLNSAIAIRRRFDKLIYIPLPDLKARLHMFKLQRDAPNNKNESDFESLACKTEGFSGSDIAVKDALFESVCKTQDAMFFVKTNEDLWVPCGPKQPGAVRSQELAEKRPTVSKSDLEVHETFTKEFGEEG
ncbi:Vps4 oligomerization, C-terminal [Cynara cardunculus var. scolymus]|uniref:Vps4 oligomerization, C-terminal n=1 Tax=Cynara cardunculus var. scolymus TaxID=59895 RepID=A0A103XH56_CYNCS|nr:Vps4 oligomerization, C-terminal [Cynara cardunculus var. scolymus]